MAITAPDPQQIFRDHLGEQEAIPAGLRVLGIDASLTGTGLSVLIEGKPVWHALLKDGGRRGVDRLVWLRSQFRTHLDSWRPDRVAIEGYSYSSSHTHAHSIGEWGGVIRTELHDRGVPMIQIPPGTWRKQLFGNGALAKDQVRLEVWKRYGFEEDSLDVLEATCVALAHYRHLAGLDAKVEPVKKGHRGKAPTEAKV